MKNCMNTVLLVVSFLFFCQPLLAGQKSIKAPWQISFSDRLQAGEMEKAFSEALANGVDVSEVLIFSLNIGGTEYEAVKSALLAGADLRAVIRLSLSKGISTAVITKAALDAGQDMQLVAGILAEEAEREGLAYTPLPGVIPGHQPAGEESPLVFGVLVGSGSQVGQNVSTSVP